MAVRDERSDAAPRDNPLLTFVREHVTLMVSVVAALVFAIRCVAVTGGDTYTASILLAQTSLGDAIRALLFSVLPSLLFFAATLAAFQAAAEFIWRAPKALGLLTVSASVALLSDYLSGALGPPRWYSFMMPILFATVFPFLLLRLTLRYIRGRSRRLRVTQRRRLRDYTLALAVGYPVLAVLSLSPSLIGGEEFWLPRERLVFKNEAPFTGYVLKATEDHLVILNYDPRIIIEKPKEDLDARDFCYPDDEGYEEDFKEAGRVMRTCP